jgi:hypothetical protein
MKNVLFAILNWDRNPGTIRKFAKKLPCKEEELLICTNMPDKWANFKGKLIEADPSVAKSKNLILDQVDGHTHCFIIEDDVKIVKTGAFSKYVKLMDDYDLGMVCYGYDKTNLVLDEKPNPAMIVNDGRGRELFVNRTACSSIIGIATSDPDHPRFDESLKMLETEFLAVDMVEAGKNPFRGFIFDVKGSWEHFDRLDFSRVREKTPELAQEDVKTRGGQISLEGSADVVLKYILEKRPKK